MPEKFQFQTSNEMKWTLVTLFAGFCLFQSSSISFGQSASVEGKIEGTLFLAAKESPTRVGGRYGRSNRVNNNENTGSKSALIWLESTTVSTFGEPENPVVLDQENLTFEPSVLAVRQNGAVRIRNSDPVYHNVFSLSKVKRFDVGRRPKGEYLDIKFDKSGVVDVFCDIHSSMRATIYVLPSTALTWKKVEGGEVFSLENIAPGNYQLKIYAMGYKEHSIPVEVTSEKPTDVGTITLNF